MEFYQKQVMNSFIESYATVVFFFFNKPIKINELGKKSLLIYLKVFWKKETDNYLPSGNPR